MTFLKWHPLGTFHCRGCHHHWFQIFNVNQLCSGSCSGTWRSRQICHLSSPLLYSTSWWYDCCIWEWSSHTVLDILGADPSLNPERLSFVSLGEGAKQQNILWIVWMRWPHCTVPCPRQDWKTNTKMPVENQRGVLVRAIMVNEIRRCRFWLLCTSLIRFVFLILWSVLFIF